MTAIALGLATVRLVWAAASALALVVLAITLAAALAPVVDRIARRMNRTAAVVTVYAAGTAILVLLGWLTLPTLWEQARSLANRAPDLVAAVQPQLEYFLPETVRVEQIFSTSVDQAVTLLQQLSAQLAAFVFSLLVVIFLSLYFLTVSPRLKWFVMSLFPRAQRRRASLIWCRMGAAMGGYFRGIAIDAAIIGVLTWVALTIVGLDFALPLASLAALGEFVPYVGPVAAAVPAIAVGLLDSPQQALIVAAVYLVLQQVESHIVTPNVMRSQTEIRPATVIVALTVGYAVGGLLGAVAAIPLFAAGRVLFLKVITPALRRAGRRRAHAPWAHARPHRADRSA